MIPQGIIPKPICAVSLIELLTAIVVVGTLVAIVGPAVSAGRESARKAVCLSNLREVSMATLNYARDNGGHLPAPNWGHASDGWLYAAPLQPEEGADPFSPLFGGDLWPYLQNKYVYQCPTDWMGFDTPVFQARDQKFSSYVMNGSAQGYSSWNDPFRIEEFAPDAIMFWEADEWMPFYYNDGANFPHEGFSLRHDQRSFVANINGFIESMDHAEWDHEVAQRPGRLWNNPQAATGGTD